MEFQSFSVCWEIKHKLLKICFLEFTLKNLVLSIEPSPNVSRGTNVTLRCKAAISSLEGEPLSSEYTIYKDNEKVYTKTSITSEDLLYPLPEAKVSNTGKYMCTISIEGKEIKSEVEKLTVTGWFELNMYMYVLYVLKC